MGLAAQPCHQADAAELEVAVRIHPEAVVAGAVKRFLAEWGITRRQNPEPYPLEHRVGEQGTAGSLQVIAGHARFVHHLPEHAGLPVLKPHHGVGGVLQHLGQKAAPLEFGGVSSWVIFHSPDRGPARPGRQE